MSIDKSQIRGMDALEKKLRWALGLAIVGVVLGGAALAVALLT